MLNKQCTNGKKLKRNLGVTESWGVK